MLNKISTKIKFIVFVQSLMIVCIIGLTITISETSKKDAMVVNIAGKQRMLTQKMTKEIFYLKSHESYDTVLLNVGVKEFEDSLNLLINGDEAIGISQAPAQNIKDKLTEVKKLWTPFKKEIDNIQLQSQHLKSLKESILTRVEKLLRLSDNVVKQMVKAKMEGSYIDDSGRQRMLSQRMTMLFLEYIKSEKTNTLVLFNDTQNLYDITIKTFLSDKNIASLPNVKKAINENFTYWQEYKKFLQDLMQIESSINQSISYIYTNNTTLLNTMDEAVSMFTVYQENKNGTLRIFQYFAAVFALIVIFYIKSVVNAIEKNMQNFVNQTKQLTKVNLVDENHILDNQSEYEEELQEASHNIQSYMQKVQNAMHFSEEAIKKAEDAVNTLQSIAEDLSKSQTIDEHINDSEDIVIESTENLMHVSKLLKKLQSNLSNISHES